jgi:hypothetical protein
LLVDIVVRNHEVVAAKPNMKMPVPIILVRTESDNVLPTIKWNGPTTYTLNARLENRIFGKFKGAALKEAQRIVRDNGGLDVGGEYGSIDIEDKEFEASEELNQKPAIAE